MWTVGKLHSLTSSLSDFDVVHAVTVFSALMNCGKQSVNLLGCSSEIKTETALLLETGPRNASLICLKKRNMQTFRVMRKHTSFKVLFRGSY